MTNINLHQFVINFDTLGECVGYTSDGSPILYNVRIGKWVANPAFCKPYVNPKGGE